MSRFDLFHGIFRVVAAFGIVSWFLVSSGFGVAEIIMVCALMLYAITGGAVVALYVRRNRG